MGSVFYLNPVDAMTLTDQKEARRRAIRDVVNLAVNKKIATPEDLALVTSGQRPLTVDVRDFQNILEAGAALDQWRTAALAAVGTDYSVFQAVNNFALANNRCLVVYGVEIQTTPIPVSRLTCRLNNITGPVKAVFDLQGLSNVLQPKGFFSESVLYGPNDQVSIWAMASVATGVFAIVKLNAFICEPTGSI